MNAKKGKERLADNEYKSVLDIPCSMLLESNPMPLKKYARKKDAILFVNVASE